MENLIYLLSQFHPLSEAFYLDLKAMLKKMDFKKGTTILGIGETCNSLYFMQKGFAKGSYFVNKEEITSWFWKENDIVTSMESFLRQTPTIEQIKTTEDCAMLSLSYEDLQILYDRYIEFNIVGRKIIEDYFLKAGGIATDLRKLSAKEKYMKLFAENPEIFQRTSLESIASYLGITPETLSRIRGVK